MHLMVLCRRGYYLEILECNLVKMVGEGEGGGWNWLLGSLEWFVGFLQIFARLCFCFIK